MHDIRGLLKIATRRLETTSFLTALHGAGIVLAAIFFVLALADRAPGEPFVAWTWVAPAFVAAAMLVGFVRWLGRRPSELEVALAVDDRLELRERLSTALHCEQRDDAFARAAVEDAVRTARDPRSRETVKRRFAVAAPRRWWITPLVVIAGVAILSLPQANVFAGDDEDENGAVAKEEAVTASAEALQVVARSIEEKPELSAELADMVEELTAAVPKADSVERPDDVRREALKKVTKLNERLDDLISGEKGKTARAIEEMMSKLRTPADGPAKDMAEALARGDFAEAKDALEQMVEQLANGDMDPQQAAQLAEQLEKLGAQLEQLAQQQAALERALQQAGLDPQLAGDPQALQQALQQAQNLNEEQRQQLQQMAQAQQQAQQMCQGLGGACRQMGQMMAQGGQQQGAQAGQGAMDQLSQMEQLQQLLQQAQAAANQAMSQCQGLGQGMAQGKGGMGGRGQGSGGKAPISPTPTGTKLTKADTPIGEGEIIASMLIDGTPVRGESKAKLKKIVSRAAEGYDEALPEEVLPRRYDEAMKHYFGELQKQVEAVVVDDTTETAPPSAPPAAPPSDTESDPSAGGDEG